MGQPANRIGTAFPTRQRRLKALHFSFIMLKIPILTYHSLRGEGQSYESNDHVALEEDLRTIDRLGYAVMPLHAIVQFVLRQVDFATHLKIVGLSFDDGPHWDWYDFQYAGAPFLKGMRRILCEAGESTLRINRPHPTAVSFVIASAEARHQLDVSCIAGRNDYTDDWWREAASGDVIAIGNHSWDHTHSALDKVAQRDQRKGTEHDHAF